MAEPRAAMSRLLIAVLILVSFAAAAAPDGTTSTVAPRSADLADAKNPFSAYTDADLSRAAGNIEAFDSNERRALFTEMRRRMASQKGRLRVEQRFGRVVRGRDGSITRMETMRVYEQDDYLEGALVDEPRRSAGGGGFGSVDASRAIEVEDPPSPVVRVEDSTQ